MRWWQWLAGLVGNKQRLAKVGIYLFIGLLSLLLWRCPKAAEIDLRLGSSFGPGGAGPVLGLNSYFPLGESLDIYAGTLLWGATPRVASNWDWHAGLRSCRWSLCASIGAAYVQRIDALNGTHANYNLEIAYRFSWHRLASIDMAHLSNAGTSPINQGRNAPLVSIRLQP